MSIFKKKEDKKTFSAVHITGLDVPENCVCKVTLDEDDVMIESCGTEYVLKMKNIRNIEFQMGIDEKQHLKSSLVKGVIGAATFGVSGAVIGSRPKEKIKREVTGYAIITYENTNSERMTIVLKDEIPNHFQCAKLYDQLKPKIQSQTDRVEL